MDNRRWSPSFPLLALGAVVLIGVGVLIGVLVKGDEAHSANEPLQASSIGNATHGRELFVSQGCSMCHTYEGRGGTDAPELDFMQGKLNATDIANMSGVIWNHVPTMRAAFAEEGIPFPSFESNQMADLIAYLHGGGSPPDVPEGGSMHEEGGSMHEEGGSMHEEGGSMHEEGGSMHGEQGTKSP